MSTGVPTCSECGARIAEGDKRCTLCGWLVGEEALSVPEAPVPKKPTFCNACGWKNPPGARFCSQCGAPLQELAPAVKKPVLPPVASQTPRAKTPAPAGMVGIVVGAALALVIGLFLVTAVSKQTHPKIPEEEAAPTAVAPEPVSGALAEQIAALDGQIESDTGLVGLALRREKAFLLMQADRLDLAAAEYQAIAETTGAEDDWRITGDLYYDFMNREEDPNRRAMIAASAVAAYEEVLTRSPDNLGVRTDLAPAYLNTGSPMLGVTQIKLVLEADSTHLDANFNYGLMLWRIGRTDQAARQFEKVKDLADQASEHYTRADEALRTMRQAGGL